MAFFFHDAHNFNNNADTNALHEIVTSSGTRNNLLFFIIVHGNMARLYSLCTR